MYQRNQEIQLDVYKKKRRKLEHFPNKVNHGQWHPDDDYLLINSVLHLMNIHNVYCGVKFSKPYQEKDIEKRWKELLFNESRSQLAMEAIRKVSLYDKDSLDTQIPFNDAENSKLNKISYSDVYPLQGGVYSSNPSMEPFSNLLMEDKFSTFYRNRTPEQLSKAWTILRKHINESVKLGGNPKSFEDVDMLIRKTAELPIGFYNSELSTDYKSFQRMFNQKLYRAATLVEPVPTVSTATGIKSATPNRPLNTRSTSIEGTLDQQLNHEISQSDKEYRRRLHRKLRMVGEEARRWTCIVEAVTEKPIIDRQSKNALATLTGTRSRFLIKEKEATFGRKSSIIKPDIDLSCEGPVFRVSRLQGCIRLTDGGQFVITNWGKQPIYVDGAVVLTKEELLLSNDAMITICGLTFRFNDHRLAHSDDTDFINDDIGANGFYEDITPVNSVTGNVGYNRISVDQTRRKQILK